MYRIVIHGHIPSKKNLLRRSANGGLFRDARVTKQINLLTLQAKAQWSGREPLERPSARVLFFVSDQRSDLDNKWTTVLDCLTQAGVLRNDNIAWGPRPVTYDWQKGEERVEIELEGGMQQMRMG